MSEKMSLAGVRLSSTPRRRLLAARNLYARQSVIALAAVAALASSARAVAPTPAFTWDATGTGDYNVPANWDPDLVNPPTNTDNQFLTINNGATAEINADAQGAFVILGLSTGQSGTLNINAGTSPSASFASAAVNRCPTTTTRPHPRSAPTTAAAAPSIKIPAPPST